MRFFFALFYLLAFYNGFSQAQPLSSKVNGWDSEEIKTKTGTKRILFKGSGAVLSRQELFGHVLIAGKKLKFDPDRNKELFFIIKYGPVHVTLNGAAYDLDKGSVVFLLPGDELVFENKRKDDVEIYELASVSNAAPDFERGNNAGPSFVMDWFGMVYRPHDRGGLRQLFDRKTVMMNRFDIHITSLNPGISSHLPHTHKNEEIILMIDGTGEMQLGDSKQQITTGDAAWVESNIPHNFTNTSNRPAVYFAIQWN